MGINDNERSILIDLIKKSVNFKATVTSCSSCEFLGGDENDVSKYCGLNPACAFPVDNPENCSCDSWQAEGDNGEEESVNEVQDD